MPAQVKPPIDAWAVGVRFSSISAAQFVEGEAVHGCPVLLSSSLTHHCHPQNTSQSPRLLGVSEREGRRHRPARAEAVLQREGLAHARCVGCVPTLPDLVAWQL